ncbi:GntR family transcriptional regulator [Plantibacter sp. Mn2098]|uniref:GntR family transcriptional regulator n=1 Tax=Plantibacter sp. Mn2098 TaxID=3395266 RepID=UPI003BE6D680
MRPALPAINLDHRLLSDVAYTRILDAILSGELAPGRLVSASKLDAIAGTSRTPVRQAVTRLADIGLLIVQPQKNTRIASLDRDVLGRRLDMLGALYTSAVEATAADLSATHLRTIDDILDRFRSDTSSQARGSEAIRFFAVFRERLGNTTLDRIRNRVSPHVRRALRLHAHFEFARALPLMQGVRDAARAGDAATAAAATRTFFDEFMPALLGTLPDTPRAVTQPRPNSRRLLRDDVYEAILTAIVEGRIAPGDVLHAGELADTLGVSREPVRDAIPRLADTGLVEVLPYRHAVVTGATTAAVNEALFIADALSRHAARRSVADLDEADLLHLDNLMRTAETQYDAEEPAALGGTIQQYISALAIPTENIELIDVLATVAPLLQSHMQQTPDGNSSTRVITMMRSFHAAAGRRDALAVHDTIGAFHEQSRHELRQPPRRTSTNTASPPRQAGRQPVGRPPARPS